MFTRGIRIVLVGGGEAFFNEVQSNLENVLESTSFVLLEDLAALLDYMQLYLPHVVLVCQEDKGEALLQYLPRFRKILWRLPLIVIGPSVGEAQAISLMREGVADMLNPDQLPNTLPAAIKRLLVSTRDKEELPQQNVQGLQLTYHHLRNLLRMTPVGVFLCDANKNCLYVNDRFCQITGLSPEEALGTGWHSAVHPEDKAVIVEDWYANKGMPEEVKTIYRYRRPKTGETAWVIGQSISETDRKGKVIGYLGSITDITRLKGVEEALQEKNENLVKINEELDNFVYSASHNLRAPITSLMGLINLIRMEAQNPELQQQICHMMELSLHKLDGFIRDILDHSRNARVQLQKQQTEVERLVQEILDEFCLQEDFGRMTISTDIRQTAPFLTDPFRLRILLRNLFSNCMRYTSLREQPKVHIAAEVSSQQAIFQISDNGPGIAQKHQERVFDMFYRADETRSGSGLGLYIARQVVEKMGGNIYLSSTLGKGTKVEFRLPNSLESRNA